MGGVRGGRGLWHTSLMLVGDFHRGRMVALVVWAFLSRGIPALFVTTGLHPDRHTPADDTDRIDFGKLTGSAGWPLGLPGSLPADPSRD